MAVVSPSQIHMAMEGGVHDVRFADGLDTAEPVALGLGAGELLTVAASGLGAYGLLHSPLPQPVAIPAAVLVLVVGAGLGWLRHDGRTLLRWCIAAGRYRLRPREGTWMLVSGLSDGSPEPTSPPPPAAAHITGPNERAASAEPPDMEPTLARDEAPSTGPEALGDSPEAPSAAQPWARWMEDSEPGRGGTAAPPQPPIQTPDPPPPPPDVAATPRINLVLVPEALEMPDQPAPEPVHPTTGEPTPPSRFTQDNHAGTDDEQDEGGVILPIWRGDFEEDEIETATLGDAGAPSPAASITSVASSAGFFVGATRRITFFSLNGGVGRTTLVTEIAGLLAATGRQENAFDGSISSLNIALVDVDLRSPTVAVRLGIPQPSIWDWVVSGSADPGRLDEFMVRHRSGLRALLGPQKPLTLGSITPAHLADVTNELERQGTHFIFFDLAADLGETNRWVLSAVHDIFVVVTPTASGIQDAYRSTEALRRMGLRHKLRYVVNRARGDINLDVTMSDLGGRITAHIAFDPEIDDAENRHDLVAGSSCAAADGLARLARVIYPALPGSARRRRRGWWRRAG